MQKAELRRLLLVATVTALSVTALIAIVALLAGDFGDTELRIMGTTAGFGLCALIATRGTALLDLNRYVTLARAVIGLSALAFLIELWVVWVDDDSEAGWKSYVCAIALAVALGQIAGMIARQRDTDPPALRVIVWAAGACAIVLAAMGCLAALAEIDTAGYYQAFGVVAVLDILGVVLLPVVRRLGTPRPSATDKSGSGFTVVLADGRRSEHEVRGDLPEEVAAALREARGRGERVARIELGPG
jgi:hypothetical protein